MRVHGRKELEMDKSESINELATALAKAQGEFDPAKMGAVNPFLKNKYADLGSVIAASKAACAKYGLAVTQPASTDGENVTVTTMLLHQSGQWISSGMTLPLGKESGRSIAQAAGSIITYLRRYSLSAILGIYADADTDGNDEPKAKAAKQTTTVVQPEPAVVENVTSGEAIRPYCAALLRDRLAMKETEYAGKGKTVTPKQRNLAAMLLSEMFPGPDSDIQRHALQQYLFGHASLKAVSDSYILVILNDWLKPTQDSGGAYRPDPLSVTEAQAAYLEAIKEQGQQELPL
jgi:hypothetical protein